MELNNIPKQGTFGNVVDKINANFGIIQEKIAEIEYLIARLDGGGNTNTLDE